MVVFIWHGGAYICTTITQVVNILQAYANRSASDAVYNLYMCPSALISNTSGTLQYSGQTSPVTLTTSFTKVNNVDGYVPRNNKVLSFPFNYLLVSNNNGSSNILHFERFSGSTCNFNIKGVPVVGGSIKLIPTNYDSTYNQEEEGLIGGKFPTLNWSEDEYTNWLTQNSVNIGLGIARWCTYNCWWPCKCKPYWWYWWNDGSDQCKLQMLLVLFMNIVYNQIVQKAV